MNMENCFLLYSDKVLLFTLHKNYGLDKIIVTKNSVSTYPSVPQLFDESEVLPGHGNDATLLRKITEDIQQKLLPAQQCMLSFTTHETVYNLLINS